jgi:hypothetical protein
LKSNCETANVYIESTGQQPPLLPNSKFMPDTSLGARRTLIHGKLALPNSVTRQTRAHRSNLKRKQAHLAKPIICIQNATRKQVLKPIPLFLNRNVNSSFKMSYESLNFNIVIPTSQNGLFPQGTVNTMRTSQLRSAS